LEYARFPPLHPDDSLLTERPQLNGWIVKNSGIDWGDDVQMLQVREGSKVRRGRRTLECPLHPMLLRLQDLHEGEASEGQEGEGDIANG